MIIFDRICSATSCTRARHFPTVLPFPVQRWTFKKVQCIRLSCQTADNLSMALVLLWGLCAHLRFTPKSTGS